MVINNKMARLYTIVLPLPPLKKGDKEITPKRVKSKKFNFRPGINIPKNAFEEEVIKANLSMLNAHANIEVLADDQTPETTIKSFTEIETPQALVLIKETVDIDTLEDLLQKEKDDSDTRLIIVHALDKQIEKVNKIQGGPEK